MHGRLITPVTELGSAPVFRTEFPVDSPVSRATLRISSLGVHEARINGTPVGDDVLSPGWTSYEHRLRYVTHDVTGLLSSQNVLTVLVGNGWYRGRLGFMGGRAFYGDRLGVIAELSILYTDGTRQLIVTDETWTADNSDVIADDLYHGQTIDARLRTEQRTWRLAVRELAFDKSLLTPYIGPVVTRQEVVAPVRVWESPTGRTLIDFGQNLVGWLRFTVTGPAGSEIRIRHAEVIENGELGTRPLRDAQATDRFILSGGSDFFEPTLTFHGFRYAEVTGWPSGVPLSLEAVVVHSDLRRTGTFECSDELLNQLHRNVVWSTRGNFLDLPTDCPQRNERLGWTGDLAVFAPTAAYLFDTSGFLADWLADLAAEQLAADGLVPFVIPDVLKYQGSPPDFPDPDSTAFWSDAAVWVPWTLWQAYGDRTILESQYPSMTAHVRRVRTLLSPSGVWDASFQFGDWLDPDAPADNPAKAKADPGVVATAAYHRSLTLVAETAALLGHDDDEAEFTALAARTREAFNTQYVTADGMIHSDCTTAYTLAIAFDLLDPALQTLAGQRLSALVADSGYRVSTGFAGTPYITDALTRTGHLDDAYRLLTEQGCPSWLYPVTMGATTVWERWDSMLPDGTINPGEMTSFNHYALGAVADWMHRTIGGISALEPGYSRVRIAPRPGGGLTWARAGLDTRHGRIEVSWQLTADGAVTADVTLPEGVTGVLSLPGQPDAELSPGTTFR
ncbi:alpha-L-rhamnosidase [Actinoplanes derwentensis]|uniref:alpha-L-rhamnosidase n=1 Tax=Actinoplanes derwentensis TaxID=113562 RepID=A0A1H1TKE2_9ACTN|nr:alpha-L-rhamnosidase [Actinoplanes derwentensis]GID85058.1 alpha-L-rhamnosidase [Actinoplanes derwentensis]SDS60723.1 alpha-L-rhamnosidase [Actinoplanes derwentensis]